MYPTSDISHFYIWFILFLPSATLAWACTRCVTSRMFKWTVGCPVHRKATNTSDEQSHIPITNRWESLLNRSSNLWLPNLTSIESMSVYNSDLSEKYLDNICFKIRLFLKICVLSWWRIFVTLFKNIFKIGLFTLEFYNFVAI